MSDCVEAVWLCSLIAAGCNICTGRLSGICTYVLPMLAPPPSPSCVSLHCAQDGGVQLVATTRDNVSPSFVLEFLKRISIIIKVTQPQLARSQGWCRGWLTDQLAQQGLQRCGLS